MAKWIHNITASEKTYEGSSIAASEFFLIPSERLSQFRSCTLLIADVASGVVKMSADGATDFAPSDGVDFLRDERILEVRTQFESEDKRIKCARSEASFGIGLTAESSIKVPSGGRYLAGGYAFSDVFGAGDIIETCEVVDVDNVLGYGAGTVLGSYQDNEADTDNVGWYFEPHYNGTGYLEIEPIGWYAYIPEGLYIVSTFKKKVGSLATKVYINYWWGKAE